jgi:hypothetical protein
MKDVKKLTPRLHREDGGRGSVRNMKAWKLTDIFLQCRHIKVDFSWPCKYRQTLQSSKTNKHYIPEIQTLHSRNTNKHYIPAIQSSIIVEHYKTKIVWIGSKNMFCSYKGSLIIVE